MMLVLTRKAHQSIRIGDDIAIKILSIRGNVVRIGVEAPLEHKVLRGEFLSATRTAEVQNAEQ
jgi:carbon storage regulator